MNTPRNRGFQMPAEWHPHRRCWMTWPTYVSADYGRLEARKVVWANVARAISRFEPVVMLANEADLVMAPLLLVPGQAQTYVQAVTGEGSLAGVTIDADGGTHGFVAN
jgi:agmatine/peptidylarginine deiminase